MGIHTARNATVLFDSVTGLVLQTPVFEDEREADAFLNWAPKQLDIDGDLRTATEMQMMLLSNDWLMLLAHHDEADCPYDGDDVGEPGWTNATDHSMGDGGTLAMPNRCTCECHEKGKVSNG